MSEPKKPCNPIVMNMTEDTLSRVCAVLSVLQKGQPDDVVTEEEIFGNSLILEGVISALEWESEKIRRD